MPSRFRKLTKARLGQCLDKTTTVLENSFERNCLNKKSSPKGCRGKFSAVKVALYVVNIHNALMSEN